VFFVIGGGRISVRLLGTGHFWCLYCEADRAYERREYQHTKRWYLVPVASWGREFILCPACDSAFDLECLDESSTAFCEELMIQVPDFARHAGLNAITSSTAGDRDSEWQSMRWVPEPEATGPRAGVRETLSARSALRRH